MIADRYADAIFQAAQGHESGQAVENIDNDLASIVALMQDNADLHQLWMHPVVKAEDKRQMVRNLFGGKVHPLTLSLIQLLFDKKRGQLFEQIQRAYRKRYNATRRLALVKVTSALPMDESQQEGLRAQLAAQLAKEIQMETSVDATLIGGVVIQIEDQVIDNSLRGRLEALRLSLN